MGVRIAIVPHDVPVAKEINIAIINTRKGSSAGVIQASVMDTTYSAVPKTSVTNPIDHAKTMMIKAGTIVLIPPRIVSSISLKPTPWNKAITAPTTVIANAAQVNATATSVSAIASISAFPSAPPPVYQSAHIPTEISVTKGKIKFQILPPSSLKGAPKSFSTYDMGLAPSAINCPVVSARCSALAIGPKSLPIMIIGTAHKLSNA